MRAHTPLLVLACANKCNVFLQESAEGERAAKERLEQERKRLFSEKTKLESRMVTLELQAKEKESEIVSLSGRLDSQEAELRSECRTQTSR